LATVPGNTKSIVDAGGAAGTLATSEFKVKSMKAVLCKAFGPPEDLVLEDIPAPQPAPGEVLVDVHASALNFPDVLMIAGKYQSQPPFPFSPGGELAGTVAALGEGTSRFQIGDRVFGGTGHGGFVEQIALSEVVLRTMPDNMDFVQASGISTTYGTSYYALKQRAALQPGETLLVLGAAGGVGLAAVMLGKAMGARVIAAASSQEKLAVTRDYGADHTILYPTGSLSREQQKAFSNEVKSATKGQGADVVYDPVGGDYSEPALRATGWQGRYLVVGFASGPIPHIPLNLVLLKGCQIVGVFWGAWSARNPSNNKANIEQVLDWCLSGKIKPYVSATYSLEKAHQALNDMAARKVKGKIVVVT